MGPEKRAPEGMPEAGSRPATMDPISRLVVAGRPDPSDQGGAGVGPDARSGVTTAEG